MAQRRPQIGTGGGAAQWRVDAAFERVAADLAHHGGAQPCLVVVDATQPNQPQVVQVVLRGDVAGVDMVLAAATQAGPLGARHAAEVRAYLAEDNIVLLAALRDGSADIVRQALRPAV